MSAIVDYQFYTDEYVGSEADQASFPALNAHAARIIGALTHWRVDALTIGRFPEEVQNLYRLAICAQIDFLALNGVDSVNGGGDAGFTVGKVTVHGKTGAGAGGAMSANISPAAISWLEQTGLMNPQVGTIEGWW